MRSNLELLKILKVYFVTHFKSHLHPGFCACIQILKLDTLTIEEANYLLNLLYVYYKNSEYNVYKVESARMVTDDDFWFFALYEYDLRLEFLNKMIEDYATE